MQQVYGSQCLSRTAVFEWHKRFLEGRETLEDDKKSGRPILVRTPEMIEKVRDFVANDRNASLKMMEEALNISRETIRTILHEDLGKTKVCAKFVPHILRSDQKSARINYSRDIVAAAENNPNFLKSIVTGDETWCFQYDPETKRQSAEWRRNPYWAEYNEVQSRLELLDESEGCDRDGFEEAFYVLSAKIHELISPSPTLRTSIFSPLQVFRDTHIRLPKLNLPTFSDKYDEWFPFFDTFNSPSSQIAKSQPNVKQSLSCAATVKPKCHFCQGDHVIYYCKNFVALPVSQRAAKIRSRKLCVNCLSSSSHASSKCTSGQCKVFQAKHNSATDPSTNNTDKEVASKEIPPPSVVAIHASGSFNSEQVMLSTAVVHVYDSDGSQDVPSFVGLRITSELRIQEICGSARFSNAPIKCLDFGRHRHGDLVQWLESNYNRDSTRTPWLSNAS
ncbi:SETMR methyltransferase, partial [Acromyrmex heyeri]